ncbi:MAG: chromate efflux transporter [Opitutae bacterium]|nr:chromate efflux transporter [Opitutae bacterium]
MFLVATPPTIPQIFLAALRLGCTSFGGPIAHLAYFRRDYVERRGWIDEPHYADLVALCQFLPGPASSQTGFGLGYLWRGWAGGIAAWIGFTLPSAALMIAFALGAGKLSALLGTGWLHGLKLAAVAVVAQAVLAMWRSLAPDAPRSALVVASAAALLLLPFVWMQLAVIAIGAAVGFAFFGRPAVDRAPSPGEERANAAQSENGGARAPRPGSFRTFRTSAILLAVFVALLVALPAIGRITPYSPAAALADKCYRAGALVFGGGHVVLPLLEREFVAPGALSSEQFLAGYGAAQAMPGPLFSFAGSLGASTSGVLGGAWATLWIFLPGLLLVAAVLPFWQTLRRDARAQAALRGANAAVVGLLLAALIHPIGAAAFGDWRSAALTAVAFLALLAPRVPVWAVVAGSAAAGFLIGPA